MMVEKLAISWSLAAMHNLSKDVARREGHVLTLNDIITASMVLVKGYILHTKICVSLSKRNERRLSSDGWLFAKGYYTYQGWM